MDSMPQSVAGDIVVGVDTHRDQHVAVAIDRLGARLGELAVSADRMGYRRLERWASSLGAVRAFGVEGTGSYGAGLVRHLRAAGRVVIEVDRPDRRLRRRLGKSDPLDAEAAARAVSAGTATTVPKSADGEVEAIRLLLVTKRSADKARTAAWTQLRTVLVTAPAELRERLAPLPRAELLRRCAALRGGPAAGPASATRHALSTLARRVRALERELATTVAALDRLTAQRAPELRARYGVGPEVAATLLVTAGDNPDRLRSEAAFAALCGVSPIPASSGLRTRHRLNRGGDRQANCALYRVVLTRLRYHAASRTYLARRLAEGRSKREIIRCLKRHVAREFYPLLTPPVPACDP
jgi:transposase